jgi:hypothetical protein
MINNKNRFKNRIFKCNEYSGVGLPRRFSQMAGGHYVAFPPAIITLIIVNVVH